MASKRQRLAQRRKAAGFTQEQFAERLGVERSTVARWESAETEPQPWLRPNLARALGVSLVELDGLLADVVSVVSKTSERPCAGADPCNADLAAVMDGLGSALTVYRPINIPAGNGSSLRVIEAAAVRIHETYQRADYGAAARLLPIVLSGAHECVLEVSGRQRQRAQRVQAVAYIAAAKLASKAGDGQLAWLAADRAAAAARLANAPGLSAVAAYQVACAFLRLPEKLSDAEGIAVATAEDLGRLGGRSDSDLLSAHGSLLLLTALIAARRGDARAARRYLADAGCMATWLGQDENRLWTAFGPTNVVIHEVSVAVALGQLDKAIRIGELLDTAQLPNPLLGRRAQVHLDLAAASTGRPGGDPYAVLHLIEAERVAPQAVYVNASARSLLTELLGRERRAVTAGLRPLAQRAGVAV